MAGANPYAAFAYGALKIGGTIVEVGGIRQRAEATAKGYEEAMRSTLFAADRTAEGGSYEAWRDELTLQRVLGQQENAYASAGVVTTSGAALDFTTDSLRELKLEKIVKERNARLETQNLRKQADYYRRAARNVRSAARTEEASAWINTASDLFGGFMQRGGDK